MYLEWELKGIPASVRASFCKVMELRGSGPTPSIHYFSSKSVSHFKTLFFFFCLLGKSKVRADALKGMLIEMSLDFTLPVCFKVRDAQLPFKCILHGQLVKLCCTLHGNQFRVGYHT